jgi:hypothetical protein
VDAAGRLAAELRAAVVDAPGTQGWEERQYGRPLALFTLALGDGFVTVAELCRSFGVGAFGWPRDAFAPTPSVRVSVRIGAGYEPATALMPTVTLPPVLVLNRPDAPR